MSAPTLDDGAIWSALPVPALVIDAGESVLRANSAAEYVLNLSARAMAGEALANRVQGYAEIAARYARVQESGAAIVINDVRLAPPQAAPFEATIRIAPMGREKQLLVLIEPRQIAGRMGRARAADAAARTAIGLAEMLAHEIKNPLAGITGAAQLLAMSLPPQDQEMTALIVDEARHILQLLEQVEQFGDLRPPRLRPVNIHDVLERARRAGEVGFASHMKISDDYDPSLPAVHGDPDLLLQVLVNLIRNAAEAGQPGGTIRLRTYFEMRLSLHDREGSRRALPIHVEISDDGPGIPEALRDSLFDPFVSGRENGTGLGLALVSKIVTAHRGIIEAESVPGRTAFTLSLPVAPETGDA